MKSIYNIPIGDNVPKIYGKRDDIFNYGVNNDYPEVLRLVADNSVTSKACIELLSSFIYGKGFENNNFTVNNEGVTPNTLLRKIAIDVSYFKGFAIHVSYNAIGEKTAFKLVPFEWVRYAKEDVNGFKSKVKVCKNWSDRKKVVTEYDVYNPDHVFSQIENAGGIDNYKGQMLYASLDFKGVYPKGYLDSVINDAISEEKSSLLKRNLITKGFISNSIIVTKPFESNNDREEFRKSIKGQMGADGAGNVAHIESTNESDKLNEEIFLQNMDSSVNDKLFEYTDRNVSDKIRKAFLNIPPALIDSNDSSIFGQSGETLKQMKLFYQEQTDHLRDFINDVAEDLFRNTVNDLMNKTNFTIKKLVKTEIS